NEGNVVCSTRQLLVDVDQFPDYEACNKGDDSNEQSIEFRRMTQNDCAGGLAIVQCVVGKVHGPGSIPFITKNIPVHEVSDSYEDYANCNTWRKAVHHFYETDFMLTEI